MTNTSHATRRAAWEAHYASGNTPWDTQITPPEVQAFWQSDRLAPVGLALDIGCGPGANVRYLAKLAGRPSALTSPSNHCRLDAAASPGVRPPSHTTHTLYKPT